MIDDVKRCAPFDGRVRHRVASFAILAVVWTASPLSASAVQTPAPVVSNVEITSDAGTDSTYHLAQYIDVDVTFDSDIASTCDPTCPGLALIIGADTVSARARNFFGGRIVQFRYTVRQTNMDGTGISVAANALTGGIKSADRTANAVLGLGAHAIMNASGHMVNGSIATSPSLTSVTVFGARRDSTYLSGERIITTVVFDRYVTANYATSKLALQIGTETRLAHAFTFGSGGIGFAYVVQPSDIDGDGVSVPADALTGGLCLGFDESCTTPVDLDLGSHEIANYRRAKVDGSKGAGITNVTLNLPMVSDIYELDDTIQVKVQFSNPVDVRSNAHFSLMIGQRSRRAAYASGTGTNELVFRYVVQSSDADADGLQIGDRPLSSGVFIAGTNRVTGRGVPFREIYTKFPGHKVMGSYVAPAVSGVSVSSGPPEATTYGRDEPIELDVTFNRPVDVTTTGGTPSLALEVGANMRQAEYVSGTGGKTLRFRYVVVAADADPDGIEVSAGGLALNGGAIDDARSSSVAAALDLGTHALARQASHQVDGALRPASSFERREYRFELAENVAGPVELGVVSATEPRGKDVSYALGEGAAGLFEVEEWGGEVTYVGGGLNAEVQSKHVIEVLASAEDGRVGKALMVVHVLDENEAPAFAEERLAFELPENMAGPLALGVAAAVDVDAGDVLSYEMASGDAQLFEVDASSGEVRYVGAGEDLDGSGPKSWELEVVATDRAGLSASVVVAVSLLDENEAPAFADSAYAFELAESAAGPVVVGTVQASDPDAGDRLSYELASGDAQLFEVDASSGDVRYVGEGEDFDGEGPKSWPLVVRATDGGGLAAEASVSVSLLDVNETPAFEAARYDWEFDENVAGPLPLGVVRASDPDRADTTLAYSLSGEGAALFEVDASSGEVRYAGDGEDYEAGPTSWQFEVVATDGEGLQGRVPAEVTLVNVNEAPAFADSLYAFELAENEAGPVELGRVEAVDEDADDALAYSLSGGSGLFEVDASSGEVRYVGSGEDYEAGPRSYELALRATDAGGLSGEARAVVALLDVNEGPEAVGAMAPKVLEAYGAPAEEDLGQYFRDPDGDALSYAAVSSAPSVAAVSVSGGRLSIAPQAIGTATVTVTARDPDGLEGTQTVAVTVEASRSERARALQAALTAFGRSVGTEAVEAIGGRLGVESSSVLGRSHVQLGSRSVGCGAFGGGASSCGWAQLARGASDLLGVQLSGAAAMAGPGGSGGGVSLDAVSLLFGDGRGGGGGQGRSASGFGGGVPGGLASGLGGGSAYNGQQAPPGPGGAEQRGGLAFNPLSSSDLRSQSSFRLSFGSDGADSGARDSGAPQSAVGTGWTVWGQANAGAFESSPDDGLTLEGRTRSVYAGLDYGFGSGLLVGLAASRNTLASDFDSEINGAGTVDARLTNLYPYAHWSPRDGLGLWGLVGAGRGSADLAETAGGRFSTDLAMRMLALGGRQELIGALALKADAFTVRITSEDGAGLAGVTAVAHRARVAPELTGRWVVGDGMAVRARFELGARYDRGDAETGLGAEAGAEFGFAHLSSGLSVDARGRTLLAHQKDQFREWGASFAVRLKPSGEEGGLSFSLEPSWGEAASGTQALWQAKAGLGGQEWGGGPVLADAPGWTPDRLAMELGWGIVLPGGAQVAPFGRWSREGAAGYRLNAGTRWTALGAPGEDQRERDPRGPQLTVDLFGEQASDGAQPAQRRVGLLGRIAFR